MPTLLERKAAFIARLKTDAAFRDSWLAKKQSERFQYLRDVFEFTEPEAALIFLFNDVRPEDSGADTLLDAEIKDAEEGVHTAFWG